LRVLCAHRLKVAAESAIWLGCGAAWLFVFWCYL
jgi:hypothetical protein